MTAKERLAEIDKAIHAVLVAGQEYWIEGMKVRRGDLGQLYRMRQQLLSELAAESGDATAVVVFER